MPYRVNVSTLNATTLDIINTIRANASLEYQNLVPNITQETDIPRVGEVLYGYPALANQFINALVNRIALVQVKSATFNNAYAELKKGYLEFGETVEEVFVQITKALSFSPEKAEQRELKRSMPDVKSAFHVMNFRALYPVTIQDDDLKTAFLSITGVQDLIAKIVDSVKTAAEYDEFLLFKYLIIKGVTKGVMYPVGIGTTPTDAAKRFRGTSNKMTFMSNKYNSRAVTTSTPKDKQYIFMDSAFNAEYDVDVLAGAFNMDKAEFIGKLKLIDDFTSFDNERFDIIRQESDGIEEVTTEELALMADVKAILVDSDWFQVYDNLTKFTEKYVSSGLYWNYFYHVWKTVSYSPFSNAVVFVQNKTTEGDADIAEFDVEIVGKDISDVGTVLTLSTAGNDEPAVKGRAIFVQGETETRNAIAVHPYGAVIIPATASATEITLTAVINGVKYTADSTISSASEVGSTVTMNKAV